jgi:uncharacterized protein DUF4124
MNAKIATVTFVVISLCATGSSALAQTVYKCKDDKGSTVYSEKPCSSDARKVEQVKVRSHTPAVDSSANFEAIKSNNEWAGIGRAEEWCVREANDRIYPPLRRRMADIDAQIARLRAAGQHANNNLAGVTYINGLRQEISALEQTKSSESAAAESMMASERQRCAETRRSAEQEFKDREAAAKAPPAQ